MSINQSRKNYIQELKSKFDSLRPGKESLLSMIDEAEIAEAVYNSNAIENSTLTLKETEKILLEMEIERDLSLREVYEAKNLARVVNYIRNKSQDKELDQETILLLHQMLIGGIDDKISGRFRKKGEYVRVGSYIAPAPELIETMMQEAIEEYRNSFDKYFIDKIAKFHLSFEHIHPFCDGNGRMGRAIINYQFQRIGFPGIIIRDKEKADYYSSFHDFDQKGKTERLEKIIALALIESFHKRLAYLESMKIITLKDYAKKHKSSVSAISNAAKRQTIPAFRERGAWKIGYSEKTR